MLNIVVVSDFAHVEGGTLPSRCQVRSGLQACGHRVTLLAAVSPVEPTLLRAVYVWYVLATCHRRRSAANTRANARSLEQDRPHVMADALRDLTLVRRWFMSTGGPRRSHPVSLEPPCLVSSKSFAPFTITSRLAQMGASSIIRPIPFANFEPLSGACITSQCDRRNYGHKLMAGSTTIRTKPFWRPAERAPPLHYRV